MQPIINSTVKFLNQPHVKENIKRVTSSLTFLFGIAEVYDVCQIIRGRNITTETNSNSSKIVQVANKVIIVAAKISLILSGGVSRPGVYIISNLINCFFTTEQLNRVFGPNTIFAVNPWHPRHVISIVSVCLALPANLQAGYRAISWTIKKIRKIAPPPQQKPQQCLTDHKVRQFALYNTVTSRPFIHIANKILRS